MPATKKTAVKKPAKKTTKKVASTKKTAVKKPALTKAAKAKKDAAALAAKKKNAAAAKRLSAAIKKKLPPDSEIMQVIANMIPMTKDEQDNYVINEDEPIKKYVIDYLTYGELKILVPTGGVMLIATKILTDKKIIGTNDSKDGPMCLSLEVKRPKEYVKDIEDIRTLN